MTGPAGGVHADLMISRFLIPLDKYPSSPLSSSILMTSNRFSAAASPNNTARSGGTT
jgi:hypothetical protein